MEYKKSRYNIIVPYKENATIIFNGLSGAIGIFNDEYLKKYKLNLLNSTEIDLLKQKGILVTNDTDEIKKIDTDRISGITRKTSKHIRIWTTSLCNAQCYYCFENGVYKHNMSYKTAQAVINFITNILNYEDELIIEWFGGEPLLNYKIIHYITKNLRSICKSKNCTLRSSIITNGSLINIQIVDKMKNLWEITSVQITLDGYGEKYNNVKNYTNKDAYNFNKVIENIKLLSKNNIHVAIRMNYDTHNYESLVELIKYLHTEFGQYNNLSYYLYPVWSSLNNEFQSHTVSDNKLLALFALLVKYKMNTFKEVVRLNARLGYRKYQCSACSANSFTIFPDGKLGKCSEVFDQNIGTVWDGITQNDIYECWTNKEIDEKCRECIYLPLCQGGCRASKFANMPQCFPNKIIFPEILKWYVSELELQSR